MAVFVLLVEALSFSAPKETAGQESGQAMTRQEFKQVIEKRQKALSEAVKNDKKLSLAFGVFFLLLTGLLITGLIVLLDYAGKKISSGAEPITPSLDPPAALWGMGDVLKVVILFLFFQCLFSVFSEALQALSSEGSFDRRAGIVASTGFMDILIFMFVLRFVTVKYGQPAEALGLSLKKFWKNAATAACSYIAFLPLLAVIFLGVTAAAEFFKYAPPPEPIYELIFEEKRPFLIYIISGLIVFLGPVFEEVFFRGFLYGALKKSFGISWAIFLSAGCFSLLHTNLMGFLPILALGVFLAYLREKTGSIVPSIIVHAVHNGAIALSMFFIKGLTSKVMG